jgi:methanogenic corrinoid protein MtbC1
MPLKRGHDGPRPRQQSGLRRAPVRAFLRAALAGDVGGAAEVALRFMANDRSRTNVIVDLFDAAQQYTAERWHVGAATAEDEYRVSAAIDAAFQALPEHRARLVSKKPPAKALLVTLRPELHDLGLRLAAAALADDGWNVDVQHGVDASDVVEVAWREHPSLVALSATYDPGNLQAELRALVREMEHLKIPLLVGGSAFVREPELAQQVHGAPVASDARVGVIFARRLTHRSRRQIPSAV